MNDAEPDIGEHCRNDHSIVTSEAARKTCKKTLLQLELFISRHMS